SAIKWIDLAMPAAPQSVVTGISGGVSGLYLDGPNDQIYWTETASRKIQRTELIGQNQNIVTISSGLAGSCGDSGAPLGLTVDSAGGHLYWTQINGLYRAALAPGSAAQGVIGSNGCTTLSTGGGIALGYASIPATPTPTHTPTATSTPTETPTPTASPTPLPGSLMVQTPGDGPVAPCSGLICATLRDAIATANDTPGPNNIAFAPGAAGDIILTEGELVIDGDLTISGPGAAALHVSGNQAS